MIALIFALSMAVGSVTGYEYIGCYGDTGTRALPYGPHAYGYTVDSCSAACANYRYFALQDGGWCCCGYSLSYATQYGESTACPSSQLGAGWANDLFENEGQDSSYVGCYGDTGNRALPNGPHAYGYDQQSCSDSCLTYKLFALQDGGWCCCGNDWEYASQYGESSACPDSQLGGPWGNDIFMHDALTECTDDCDDGDLCTEDFCDPLTGECTYTETVCDDDDPCTTDTCDSATGCVFTTIDCNDGNICNGEEACMDGECVSPNDFECPADHICDSDQGRCVRDCTVFAIDAYLNDCSVNHDEAQQLFLTLSTNMNTALNEIDEVKGRVDMTEADIASLSTVQEDAVERLAAVEEELARVSVLLGGLAPVDSLGDNAENSFADPSGQNASPFFAVDSNQLDWKIVAAFLAMLAMNVALLLYICCARQAAPKYYGRVVQYASADEENVKLNQ